MAVNRGRQSRALRLARPLSLVAAGLILASCGSADKFARKVDPKYGVPSSPRVIADGRPIPKGGGTYRVGKPYVVAGRSYVPEENPNYVAEGLASWYGSDFHGRLTANGEIFDKEAISAAHPTLPMPSYVRVTNLRNRKSLIVRVNDRGPFHADRVIDLSYRAAHLLGFHDKGVARVRVEYVGPASLEGSDDRKLMATLREGQPAPAPIMVASTRPLVPAAASMRVPARGAVPIPSSRPYSLGEPVTAASSDMEMTSMARIRRPGVPAGQTPAVSAIAATRDEKPAAGVISGRGLY
jgi:rare lipoprotein A